MTTGLIITLVIVAALAAAGIGVWFGLRKSKADRASDLNAIVEASTDDTESDLRDARAIPDAVRRLRAIDAAAVEFVKRRDPPQGPK